MLRFALLSFAFFAKPINWSIYSQGLSCEIYRISKPAAQWLFENCFDNCRFEYLVVTFFGRKNHREILSPDDVRNSRSVEKKNHFWDQRNSFWAKLTPPRSPRWPPPPPRPPLGIIPRPRPIPRKAPRPRPRGCFDFLSTFNIGAFLSMSGRIANRTWKFVYIFVSNWIINRRSQTVVTWLPRMKMLLKCALRPSR